MFSCGILSLVTISLFAQRKGVVRVLYLDLELHRESSKDVLKEPVAQ